MALSPEVQAILGRYQAPSGGADFVGSTGSDATTTEEPGLVESVARGAKKGLLFDWDDEIEAGLRSAFSDRKYTEIRDEIRAKDKAAQEAHPWGFGLAQALGGAATGLATGGAGGAVGLAGTTARVAALAGAEGALGAAGASEADLTKGQLGDFAKDTAIGAGTGAVAGAALHKVFGRYVDSSVERRAKHLTEDVGEGAIPTVKRRLGQVTNPDEVTGQSLAVDVLDSDPEFLKALKAGQKEAKEVVGERLDALGKEVKPLYQEIDRETGGVPLGAVRGHLDDAIKGADLPGNSNIREALEGTRDDLLNTYRRKLDVDPTANLDDVQVPTQEVRQWITRLLKRADQSMGSLSETERKVVKDEVHGVAHNFLKGYLDDVSKGIPELAPTVDSILAANKKIRVYASVQEALEKAGERKNWSPQNLRQILGQAGLPGIAAVAGAGGDVLTGGAYFAGVKTAQAAGKAVNRSATFQLSNLVRAVKAGDATKATVLEAIRAGVPMGLLQGVVNSWRGAPDDVKALVSETGSAGADLVTGG